MAIIKFQKIKFLNRSFETIILLFIIAQILDKNLKILLSYNIVLSTYDSIVILSFT